MILYCDTSSLIKLYVQEQHSASVRIWLHNADLVATCRIALPEMFSAVTRRFNKRDLTEEQFVRLTGAIRDDWRHVVALDVDEVAAAVLVERHRLRGYDAVHLAAAVRLSGANDVDLAFSSFDTALNRAAAAEGLKVLEA